MSQFHDVRFPLSVSFKSTGGPLRRTEIIELQSGAEERNTPWAHGRRRYDAGTGIRSMAEMEQVLAFFEARHGRLHAFRWLDFTDCNSCAAGATISPVDQSLGIGDGQAIDFQLQKTYEPGAHAYVRPITRPVAGSVRVALDGVEIPEADFTVDWNTGQIHFALPPSPGVQVSAGFAFDVPVRFDTDELAVSLVGFQAGRIPGIAIIEVRDA